MAGRRPQRLAGVPLPHGPVAGGLGSGDAQGDPDLTAVVESLGLALAALNPDCEKGIAHSDTSVEALIRVTGHTPHVADMLAGWQRDEALATLERYTADGFRAKKTLLGPGAWGQPLAFRKEREQ